MTARNLFDDGVLTSAVGGDAEAWDVIVDAMLPALWRSINGSGITGVDAAEVSRVVWLRLAQRLDRFPNAAAVVSWVTSTATVEGRRLVRQQALASAQAAQAARAARAAPSPRASADNVLLFPGFAEAPTA